MDALGLARWLTSPEHPLTSRVAVNRIWQEVFGRGIVFTSEDFGTQGDPSRRIPELLDWLASEFMQRGWSMKQMVRLMVTSSTYRQSSNARPELAAKDPDNTLLARQSRLRLPAELIRDEALYAAGLLDLRVGGPQREAAAAQGGRGAFLCGECEVGREYGRGPVPSRAVHTFPTHRSLSAVDGASTRHYSPVWLVPRRERTNTPLQALNLMNDPVFFEAAQGLAYRIMRESSGGFRQRLNHAYAITLGRQPTAHEAERMGKYFDDTSRGLAADPKTVAALFPNQLEGVPQAETAAWVELSRVLLNLDEFITRD